MLLSPALRVFSLVIICLFGAHALAQEAPDGALKEVPLQSLSDRSLTPLARRR
ncbi:MAG: hypothetical protein WDN28_01535 [Chthoniobacter sp.]